MDAQSTEQNQETKRSDFLRWFLIPIIVFFIYILGSGPAMKLAGNRVLPFTLVSTIYDPLNSFCFANHATSRLYGGYLKLWGVVGVVIDGSLQEIPPKGVLYLRAK